MNNPITFSTLGCPTWSVDTIVEQAAAFGYQGIEWRGGPDGHVTPALPAIERARLRRRVADAGLFALSVTAYTSFVSPNRDQNRASVDDLKQHLDLAADLGARYVRVFFGELIPNTDLTTSYPSVAACIDAAAKHARQVGVGLAIEPHDDFMQFDTVLPILNRACNPEVGVLWDVANNFAVGDDLGEAFKRLSTRIFYVHVKDGFGFWPDWQPTRIGEGQVPWLWALSKLLGNGYDGPFSVEWERAWHPELDPPEIALPHAYQTVRTLLNTVERLETQETYAR
jgi:sugar phosphate isomerase/epimerase